MSNKHTIVDHPLPLSQNFKLLKEKSLSFIQKSSDSNWTNLNPSDPGVTILDQVCYALTELGYCNDFEIKDILADINNELIIENQFYLPDQILTTSPITINDYRKYLIDAVEGIDNASINVIEKSSSFNLNVFKSYLLIDPSREKDTEAICNAAFFALNAARNINELFLMPEPYSKKVFTLSGGITIDSIKNLTDVLSNISVAIRHHIFPKVKQLGYNVLKHDSLDTNAIFNGPNLKNGWIKTNQLGVKKNMLEDFEISLLIGATKHVKSVPDIRGIGTKSVLHNEERLLVLDLQTSLCGKEKKDKKTEPTLEIICNGDKVDEKIIDQALSDLKSIALKSKTPKSASTIKLVPKLPKGSYKHIESYYSIQNTFPEIYKVGKDQLDTNAKDFEIARVRQLKGYLALFDQVLANQFSQLANVFRLFSFKNSLTAAPLDLKKFYKKKDDYQKAHLKYPQPFEVFSPTYFYQSIHKTPNIGPLLENNEAHKYTYEQISEHELKHKSWKDYKRDPYNSYMHGLQTIMANDEINFVRRNTILDHLLSRFGEAPLLMDKIILGIELSGNNLKDKIILKSLYLQNLAILSYNRFKSHNYLSASLLDSSILTESQAFDAALLIESFKDYNLSNNNIDQLEKIIPQDVINFSAFELKLKLLFGLGVTYHKFILSSATKLTIKTKVLPNLKTQMQVALWFIQQRRGILFFETNLLLKVAEYEIVILKRGLEKDLFYSTLVPLSFSRAMGFRNWLEDTSKYVIENALTNKTIVINENVYQLDKKESYKWEGPWFKLQETEDLKFVIIAKWDEATKTYINDPRFNSCVDVIIPSFIEDLNTPAFKTSLSLFLEHELPIHVKPHKHFYDEDVLKRIIPKFVKWHNAMRFNQSKKTTTKEIAKESAGLAAEILTIKAAKP